MITFNNYLKTRLVEYQIDVIARSYLENQGNPQTAQALDGAKQQLMTAFEQQFKSDAQGALTWLNDLFTKVLPNDYKTKYAEFQKTQGNQQQTGNQQQAQPQGNQAQGGTPQQQAGNQ
jgi:hypothetical protein